MTAIDDALPVLFPFFAPGEWTLAGGANLGGKCLFSITILSHDRYLSLNSQQDVPSLLCALLALR